MQLFPNVNWAACSPVNCLLIIKHPKIDDFNMANIWLSKVQKIFEIHRRIRPLLSTQNKTLRAMIARWRLKAVIIAAIWLADIRLIDLSWHLIGCSKLNWQKFIKNRPDGNIGFWCGYIIVRGSKPSSWIEAKCLASIKQSYQTVRCMSSYTTYWNCKWFEPRSHIIK